jgi:hypothetical protein
MTSHKKNSESNSEKAENALTVASGGLGAAALAKFIYSGGLRGVDLDAAPSVQIMSNNEGSFGNQAKGLESLLKAEGIKTAPFSWGFTGAGERKPGWQRILHAPFSDASIYLGHNTNVLKHLADIGKLKYRVNTDFREGNFLSPHILHHGGSGETLKQSLARKIILLLGGGDKMAVRENPKHYDRFFTPGDASEAMPEMYQGKKPSVMTGNIPTRDIFGETPYNEKKWSPGEKIKAILTTGGGNAMPQVFDELASEHAGLAKGAPRPSLYDVDKRWISPKPWRNYDVKKKFFIDDILENLRKTHGKDNVELDWLTGYNPKVTAWPGNVELMHELREHMKTPEGAERFKGLNVLDHIDDMPKAFSDAHYIFATPGSTVAEVMRMPGEHVPKLVNMLPNQEAEGYMNHFTTNANETVKKFPGAKVWDATAEDRNAALAKIMAEPHSIAKGRTKGYETSMGDIGRVIREDVKQNKVKNIKTLLALTGAGLGAFGLSRVIKKIRELRAKKPEKEETKQAEFFSKIASFIKASGSDIDIMFDKKVETKPKDPLDGRLKKNKAIVEVKETGLEEPKLHKHKIKIALEKLRGGKGDRKSDESFSSSELRKGTTHELEHTKDKELAKEIAKDHLSEVKDYYSKLQKANID